MKECIELEECEAIDLGDNGPHQQNRLLNLLGYIAREGYTYQDGSDSGAPAVIYADADYEIGDGKCGLHETVKSANEPAIVYVRADTVLAQQSAIDTLTARVAELEEVPTSKSGAGKSSDWAAWSDAAARTSPMPSSGWAM